jgi:hypothetical protein
MGKFSVRHRFDISQETFWERCFLDESFNDRLFREGLGFREYELIEARQDGERLHRRVRTTPKADAPKVVQKLLGGEFSYLEQGVFDGEKYTFDVIPSVMADRIKIRGEIRTESKGEEAMERVCSMQISIKIFGVGRVVEAFVDETTRANYEKGAQFIRSYISEQGL